MIYKADIAAARQQAGQLDPTVVQLELHRAAEGLKLATPGTAVAARLRRQHEWWTEVGRQQNIAGNVPFPSAIYLSTSR